MVSKITKTLEILGDGRWHEMDKLQEKMELSEVQTQETIKFLSQFGFVKADQTNKRVKISKNVKAFLSKTQVDT